MNDITKDQLSFLYQRAITIAKIELEVYGSKAADDQNLSDERIVSITKDGKIQVRSEVWRYSNDTETHETDINFGFLYWSVEAIQDHFENLKSEAEEARAEMEALTKAKNEIEARERERQEYKRLKAKFEGESANG